MNKKCNTCIKLVIYWSHNLSIDEMGSNPQSLI